MHGPQASMTQKWSPQGVFPDVIYEFNILYTMFPVVERNVLLISSGCQFVN